MENRVCEVSFLTSFILRQKRLFVKQKTKFF